MFVEASYSNFPVVDPECDASAMAQFDAVSTASKRDAEEMEGEVVERVASDFHALDLAKFTVKPRQYKGKELIAVKYDGLQPLVNMTPGPEDWLNLPFGIRQRRGVEAGKFAPWEAVLQLEDEALRWVSAVESRLEGEVLPKYPGKGWGKTLFNDLLTVEVALGEEDRGETRMGVKLPGKEVAMGSSEDFLRPILEKNFDLKHAKAKVVLKLTKIWVSEKNVGTQWRANILIMKVQPVAKVAMPTGWGDLFKKR